MKKFFFLLIFIFTSIQPIKSEIPIKTSSGYVTGSLKDNILTWEDIPYAQPPINDLRWKAPREIIPSYKDVVISPKKDNFCIQSPGGLGGSDGEGFFSGTEDCLYLDIKAPKKNSEKLLPVMFWIHGGGNTSGFKDQYDFSKMVKNYDVIVVTINYRLGPFGWFTHPSIQEFQSGLDKSSNFGTMDIISALKWVQKNISLFGGDPNNVTIFGESAGGHNVLSLLVSNQAKGLFHKAISQSGYTTSYTKIDAYKPKNNSSISKFSSWSVVKRILDDKSLDLQQKKLDNLEIRNYLKNMPAKDFFSYYSEKKSYQNVPLLTADGIVIPEIGLKAALSEPQYVNKVPTIAGSNRDEVKFWLASAEYFVNVKYSLFGSVFGIPRIELKDKEVFNIFNKYRSKAWKIRGVDEPLSGLYEAGNKNLYAYRYDWDDHRKFIFADLKELIGAAHATEIPLLTGNNDLVGKYGFLLYPRGLSKRFTSKNMMIFWTNFAKNGNPGSSTNGIKWQRYDGSNKVSNYMILDKRSKLGMNNDNFSFSSLSKELYNENKLTELEKCVVLLQILTYVGNDLYDTYKNDYPGICDRSKSENFLIENSSFIEF